MPSGGDVEVVPVDLDRLLKLKDRCIACGEPSKFVVCRDCRRAAGYAVEGDDGEGGDA